MSQVTLDPPAPKPSAESRVKRSRRKRLTLLSNHGEAYVWLTGGALCLGLMMVVGLLGLVLFRGARTFWPTDVVRVELMDGRSLIGEIVRTDRYAPGPEDLERLGPERGEAVAAALKDRGGLSNRYLVRHVNPRIRDEEENTWVSDFELSSSETVELKGLEEFAERPEWALVIERYADGRYYGELTGMLRDGELIAETPEAAWEQYEQAHDEMLSLRGRSKRLERERVGEIRDGIEEARLKVRRAEIEHGVGSPEAAAAELEHTAAKELGQVAIGELQVESGAIRDEAKRYTLRLTNELGEEELVPVWDAVRAVPVNRLGVVGKTGVYADRWSEFLTENPRKGIQEGGVFPAIFGTVVMTLIMSIAVVPFGVLAALYLREYARQGTLVSAVRIAVNNLAGVPSIVFGVFGLGFFCYGLGSWMDSSFYAERLPNPTFGKGGLLWASLTLALLTLPVVIVATEEALAAVPGSMREGSYACGATKWQTIRRIVLPRALPGILTGMILAVARGAGEVAPLMLVGAVALAPELPLALAFPEFGVQRSFMHLGYQIYELGFKSPDAEAAIPFVFTTTLLLILIVVSLNLLVIWVRARLRRRYMIG